MPFPAMTSDEFRAALASLRFTQASFARFLTEYGHPAAHVARSVRRWATETGPPGEVMVILRLLREGGAGGVGAARPQGWR